MLHMVVCVLLFYDMAIQEEPAHIQLLLLWRGHIARAWKKSIIFHDY